MKGHLSEITYKSITEKLKTAYSIIKAHKNFTHRPIISSIISITSGMEAYLQKLLKPIVKECTYTLKSTKD